MVLRIRDTKKIRQFMYMLIWCQICVNGTSFLFIIAECRPFETLWIEDIPGGYCVPNHVQAALSLLQGSEYSAILDPDEAELTFFFDSMFYNCRFGLHVFTILVVWKVKISLAKRISICILMSLGLM